MRKALLMAALLAVYTFHLKATDGRTALLANPDLKMSEEQLERASHDRVMLLDHAEGTHWKWLMLSWKPDVEQRINTRAGGGLPEKDADLGLTPKVDGKITVRCLQEECRVGKAVLKNGQATDVEPDVDVAVTPTR